MGGLSTRAVEPIGPWRPPHENCASTPINKGGTTPSTRALAGRVCPALPAVLHASSDAQAVRAADELSAPARCRVDDLRASASPSHCSRIAAACSVSPLIAAASLPHRRRIAPSLPPHRALVAAVSSLRRGRIVRHRVTAQRRARVARHSHSDLCCLRSSALSGSSCGTARPRAVPHGAGTIARRRARSSRGRACSTCLKRHIDRPARQVDPPAGRSLAHERSESAH